MFENRRTSNGLKLILPPLDHRPVSQQRIPTRPQTVTHRKILTPLEKLKILRKLRKGYFYFLKRSLSQKMCPSISQDRCVGLL